MFPKKSIKIFMVAIVDFYPFLSNADNSIVLVQIL